MDPQPQRLPSTRTSTSAESPADRTAIPGPVDGAVGELVARLLRGEQGHRDGADGHRPDRERKRGDAGPGADRLAALLGRKGVRYGATEVLHGIDFDVRPGEVFGLLGPNGAGKTTTIEILEGYREQIGLVLQECQLDPLLTVRETLSLFASFYRSPRPVDETVELVGLGDGRDQRVGTLSGGQRRRLDVAVGLIGDPRLLFLDEPTTGSTPRPGAAPGR